MDILIAGKGFIGTAIGDRLSGEHQVKYLDRISGNFQQDITQSFEIDEQFDVLIHTVGLAPGFASKKQYEEVHVDGTGNLIDAVDCDKIIYLSALGVGEVDHSFFKTKNKAEELVQGSGRDYTIIRPSTVYGEGNKLLDIIRKLAPTRLFPNLETRTQPIKLEDLTQLVSETVEAYDGKVLNAAGPETYSLSEMAKRIYSQEGYSCILVPAPEFMIKLKLLGLSFLGSPFQPENIEIVRSSNTTEENDAADILQLSNLF